MEILMRYPGGRDKAVTLSYDDGVYQDIRLIAIMKKNGLKGTFNINSAILAETDAEGHGRLSKKQALELYPASGNEVAVHFETHAFPTEMPEHLLTLEILRDRAALEEAFGGIICGAAYPYGACNDRVVACMQASGMAYSRTTAANQNFDLPKEWLRWGSTCHHNHPRLFELAELFLEYDSVRAPHRPAKLFYLWGHSYEFDNDNNWERIERFAEIVGNREDVWYATNIEIYDYVQAYERLQFNTKATFVTNPSASDVWFVKNGELVMVKAGESKTI